MCESDGLRAVGGCPTAVALAPRGSRFERPSPHHRLVHLDPSSGLRVHGGCESVRGDGPRNPVRAATGPGVLFPALETPAYRPLPPYRPDCAATSPESARRRPGRLHLPESRDPHLHPGRAGGTEGAGDLHRRAPRSRRDPALAPGRPLRRLDERVPRTGAGCGAGASYADRGGRRRESGAPGVRGAGAGGRCA